MPKGDPPDATLKVRAPTAHSFAGGRYAVQRLLGEGGQKVVYLVHDTALDRECALAWIKLHGLDADDVERLRQEAMLMARLGAHPNIVTVYDIGGEEGRPYVISEYVAGGDLAGLVREAGGPLPIDRALVIGADIARALAAAHERGVVHRDLKPANVWLTETGAAKLGDFGLALAADRSRLTQTGTMVGTAAYMAPEQALGGDVDARSDLYALGCVLYELVTGRPPFLGDDALAVISQHVNTAPVAPSRRNREVPPALEALILRLLAKAPEQRPQSAVVTGEMLARIRSAPSAADTELQAGASPLEWLAGGVLVGRDHEIAELRRALEDALSARKRLVMLAGEPGIGKTRLAEEFATYANLRGSRVLWGRCYEGEGAPAYWPWVQVIRSYLHDRETDALRSEMGPGAPDIAQVVPEVRERLPDLPKAPSLESEHARFRLFDSISNFLNKAAEHQPLVLILDDLHWADKPSLLLLRFLMNERDDARLLVVGAYRDVELDRTHPLAEVLGELRNDPGYQRLLLRSLPRDDVRALIAAVAEQDVPEEFVQTIYQETEGNPFFVTEVLKHLVEEGKVRWEGEQLTTGGLSVEQLGIPEGVREVIGRRLSRLSEGCNQMLSLASAMPSGFAWDLLTAVSEESDERLLDFLDEGLAAQIVRERRGDGATGRYEFTHALIRQTLYVELSTPRRVRLHRRIGEAMERVYERELDHHLAELAYHFSEAAAAGDADKAVDYAQQAGERAQSQAAYEEAARLYQMALQALELKTAADDMERCELLLALGDVQMKGGDVQLGRETLLRSAGVAKKQGAGEQLARAALSFGGNFLLEVGTDYYESGVALLEEALSVLGQEDSALRSTVLSRLAVECLGQPDSQERMLQLSQQGLEMARRVGDPAALVWALCTRYSCRDPSPDAEAQLAIAREIIEIGQQAGDKELAMMGMGYRIVQLLVIGDLAAADAAIEEQSNLAEELRQPTHLWGAEFPKATRALMEGRFEEGERLARHALELGQRTQHPWAHATSVISMLALRREQGRLGEIESDVRASIEEDPTEGGWPAALAFIYVELLRFEEARALVNELAANDFGGRKRPSWLFTLSLCSETCSGLGDAGIAAKLHELLVPYSGYNMVCTDDTPFCFWGATTRYLGLLATTMARWEEASQHFEDALVRHARLGARPWLARTQFDYAKMLLARGDRGDRAKARELLAESLAAARDIGMTALVQQTEALEMNTRGGRE